MRRSCPGSLSSRVEYHYYALGVDPRRGDIYVGDAIDYQQQGVVYRFSADGRGLDTLRVGIIPTDFCFR